MKTLTSAARIAAAAQIGTRPITILKIEWPSGTAYYADSDYTFGANSCAGKIISMGDSASISKALSIGEVSTISVVLDDNDLSIKSKINTDLVEGVFCTVYFHFDGLTAADAVTLMRGRIQGDINWEQGSRQLSFTIDANTLADKELGFSATRLDLPTMSTESEGKAWPLCFGTVLKVPALSIYKPKLTKLIGQIIASNVSVQIDNGASWPQGTTTTIDVDNNFWHIRFKGTFSGNTFTITEKNSTKYTALACAARVVGDPDINNAAVFWITDPTINLVSNYLYMVIGPNKYVNYIQYQNGAKCYCSKAWRKDGTDTNLLLDNTYTITEVRGGVDTSWGTTYKSQYKTTDSFGNVTWVTGVEAKPDQYILIPGSPVTEYVGHAYSYVANLIASSAILGVYAYRTYDGEKTLQPVPSSYYVKNIADTTLLAGKTCTSITFKDLLSSRTIEKWEDEIYVSLRSTVGSNTADQLQWIIQNYSSISVDATSFATVQTAVSNYPSNFALLDPKSVISVLEDMSFQARIGLLISSGTAFIRYLSTVPLSIEYTMTEDLIKLKSLTMSFTKSEELVTEYTANWQPDYVTERVFIYKNNQSVLGVKKDEKDFYIYNIESLVQLSARYWGWRLSNSWRTLNYSAFLPAVGSEVFDRVNNRITTLGPTDIRGQITESKHNTEDQVINLQVILASLSGVSSGSQPVESITFYTGDPANPITGLEIMPVDPGAGLSEVDYSVLVDTKTNNPEQKEKKYSVQVTFDTSTFQRGVNESVTYRLVDENGNWIGDSVVGIITIASDDSLDIISPALVSLVGGVATVNTVITGGSGIDQGVIKCEIYNQTWSGLSKGFKIQDEGAITWSYQPFSVVRGSTFSVSLTGGALSAVYSVSVIEGDTTDNLYNTSGLVTMITTDASGNYSATDWMFADGNYAIDDKTIVLTRSGNTFPSESITLVTDASSPGIVYKITGSWTLGQVLMNNGFGDWIIGDPLSAQGKTLGVVARIVASDIYLVVRGLCCLTSLADHTTYNLGAGGTLGSTAGYFVLRAYQNKLCWIGGAGAVNKLDDIGDVDVTGPGNGDLLVYDTAASKWFTGIVSSPDSTISYSYSGGAIQFRLNANGVTFAKIQQIAATSVLCNPTGATANVQALAATTDNQVLTRQSGSLVWSLLSSALLPASGVTAGTYGSNAWAAPVITINANGIITSATNTTWSTATDTSNVTGLGFVSGVLTLGTASAIFNASKLQGKAISATNPTVNTEFLWYDAANGRWAPFDIWGGAVGKGSMSFYDASLPAGSGKTSNLPGPTTKGCVLAYPDYTAGDPNWTRTVEVGDTSAGGGSMKVWFGTGHSVDISSDRVVITYSSGNTVTIDSADFVGTSRAVKLREIDVCDAGVAKKQLVLCSATY